MRWYLVMCSRTECVAVSSGYASRFILPCNVLINVSDRICRFRVQVQGSGGEARMEEEDPH